MPASTVQVNPGGTQINTGDKKSVIELAESNNLKTTGGKVGQVVVWDVGSAATIDVYDDASANTNKCWGWVTADGKGTFPIQMPMKNGIRIVTAGTTPPKLTVVWS